MISLRTISFLLLILVFLFNQKLYSKANDTIDTSQALRGNQTLISSGGKFELGFFSPGNSKNWYIGIWYRNITDKIPVWVANREAPLKNITSGALKIIKPGLLAIIDEANGTIWSSNTSKSVRDPIAQLLENGNLVLRDANDDRPENYLWQSFDIITDTILPDMKFGWNYLAGIEYYSSAWKSIDDPAPGEHTAHLDPTGYPQLVIRKGTVPMYRMGPWNGAFYSGMTNFSKDPTFTLNMSMNKNGVFNMEDVIDHSLKTKYTLNPSGSAVRSVWVQEIQNWVFSMSVPTDFCDNYNICGPYGICNIGNALVCSCLEKFVPQDPRGWTKLDRSKGCVRRKSLNCQGGDGFLRYSNIKLPDATYTWYNESMTLEECKVKCLQNCSCMAYTNLDIKGRGCLHWFGDLVDIRVLSADGQDLYIRMASSELATNILLEKKKSRGSRKKIVAAILSTAGSSFLVLILLVCRWEKGGTIQIEHTHPGRAYKKFIWYSDAGTLDEAHDQDLELPLFDLRTILTATSNF